VTGSKLVCSKILLVRRTGLLYCRVRERVDWILEISAVNRIVFCES